MAEHNTTVANNSQPIKVVGTKLPLNEAALFKDFCAARGENVSSVLRRLILTELAVHSFLDDHRKKALGIPNERN